MRSAAGCAGGVAFCAATRAGAPSASAVARPTSPRVNRAIVVHTTANPVRGKILPVRHIIIRGGAATLAALIALAVSQAPLGSPLFFALTAVPCVVYALLLRHILGP